MALYKDRLSGEELAEYERRVRLACEALGVPDAGVVGVGGDGDRAEMTPLRPFNQPDSSSDEPEDDLCPF